MPQPTVTSRPLGPWAIPASMLRSACASWSRAARKRHAVVPHHETTGDDLVVDRGTTISTPLSMVMRSPTSRCCSRSGGAATADLAGATAVEQRQE